METAFAIKHPERLRSPPLVEPAAIVGPYKRAGTEKRNHRAAPRLTLMGQRFAILHTSVNRSQVQSSAP